MVSAPIKKSNWISELAVYLPFGEKGLSLKLSILSFEHFEGFGILNLRITTAVTRIVKTKPWNPTVPIGISAKVLYKASIVLVLPIHVVFSQRAR